MKAMLRNLRQKFSSTKEETELVTDIQDRKPENLRTEETNMTPIEVKKDKEAA